MNLRQSILSVARLLAGVICLTFFGGTASSLAAGLFEQATPADMAAVANRRISRDAVTVRQRFVRINQTELTRHLAPVGMDQSPERVERAQALDGNITLELFPNAVVNLRRTDVTANPDGGYVWEGADPDKAFFEALLIIENGTVYGRVQLKDRLFRISHVGAGLHLVSELDPSRFLPEAPPQQSTPNTSPIDPIERNRNELRLPSATEAPRAAALPTGVPVRVLVAYTAAARADATAQGSSIAQEINKAIVLANQAYKRGNIPIVLQAAAPTFVTYAETGNSSTDLNALRSGPAFAAIRTKRNDVDADLVSLLVANSNACGLAPLPDLNPDSGMPTPGLTSRVNDIYSVVKLDCIDNLSFHHELAHNMGLTHDRFVKPAAANAVYNYGYVNLPKRIRTVMAYPNKCKAVGVNCTRVNWFSSPTVKARPGNVTIGVAQDKAGAADNTRRLKETAFLAASYTPWPVTASAKSLDPPADTSQREAFGVSGDGSVVVGWSFSSTSAEAFRWTKAGRVGLGVLPGYNMSQAFGANADGSVVVGLSRPSSGNERGFRWTKAGMVGLEPNDRASTARGVSADGLVIVGGAYFGTSHQASRWTEAGIVRLGLLPGHTGSLANSLAMAVSADGSVVVGTSSNGTLSEAFRWTKAGMVGLGTLPGHTISEAFGVSADGSVVVGTSYENFSQYEAFRWTKAGRIRLGFLPGQSTSMASGVSADGSVVVGTSGGEAFRWTAATGMKSINALLAARGISFTVGRVNGVSADGSTFVGGTGNPSKAYIATLPLPPPGP